MFEIRLNPVEQAVKRPPDAKKSLPDWARGALTNQKYVGMTAEGRVPVSRSGQRGVEGGWMTQGVFTAFPFPGRSVCAAVHPSRERMLVQKGGYLQEQLCELDLVSGEVEPFGSHPGTTGLYVSDDLVVTSSLGVNSKGTTLWGREAGVWTRLHHLRASGRPLAGPFAVSCGDEVVSVVLLEDRISMGHRAIVVAIHNDRLHEAGLIAPNEPAGLGGYGKDPFMRDGTLLIKSQKKRSSGASWYALVLIRAEATARRRADNTETATRDANRARVLGAWRDLVAGSAGDPEAADRVGAFRELVGRELPPLLAMMGAPDGPSGTVFLPSFRELIAAENSFMRAREASRGHTAPLTQIFTGCYHLEDDAAGGDSFMVWLPPGARNEAMVVRWSHEEGRPTQVAAADLPTWYWLTGRLGDRTLGRFEVVDGQYGRGGWEPMGAKAEAAFDAHCGAFRRNERELAQCEARARWIVQALAHGEVAQDALDVAGRGMRAEFETRQPEFSHDPPAALYWLWRSFLLGERETLTSLLALLGGSRSRFVRDARALVLAYRDRAGIAEVLAPAALAGVRAALQ